MRGLYPPGSTIKPMLALVALTEGYRDSRETTRCEGGFRLSGSSRVFRDWKRDGHGVVDIHDAIAQSCDVYFYRLARDMDIEGIHAGLLRFGFGALSGIDISGEKIGIVPSRAWKRAAFSDPAQQPWFPGETVVTGIGQGSLVVTPLQLAQAVAQVAMRGIRYRPRLVEAIRDPLSGRLDRLPPKPAEILFPEAPEHWQTVVDSMVAVLHGPKGTARTTGERLGFTAAGKTGTSQVVAMPQDGEEDPGEVAERFRDHSLFVAFAPVDDPIIALAVIVENGGFRIRRRGRSGGPGSGELSGKPCSALTGWRKRDEYGGGQLRRLRPAATHAVGRVASGVGAAADPGGLAVLYSASGGSGELVLFRFRGC